MTDNTETALRHALQHKNNSLDTLFMKLKELQELQKILNSLLEPKLAAACQVVSVENNIMTVMTHSALWATRFRFQAPQLLDQLKTYESLKELKNIFCKIAPKHIITAENIPSISEPMESLSPATAKFILDAAQTIKDSKLKSVMEKISGHTKAKA